jgi:hypothetical protein
MLLKTLLNYDPRCWMEVNFELEFDAGCLREQWEHIIKQKVGRDNNISHLVTTFF